MASPRGARRRLVVLLACVLSGGAAALGCSRGEEQGKERPNLVVILIDTLRTDHLELYGYEKATAPFLAELARNSVVYRRAFSTSSWTAPATASLFTGMYPTRHGVTEGFRAQTGTGGQGGRAKPPPQLRLTALPRTVKTLPELLRAAGYRTYGLSANINIGTKLGFDRGFDRFEKHDKEDGDARTLACIALEWRPELEADPPYFLYLHFNDVHRPYRAREPWYRRGEGLIGEAIARYDSEISYVDTEIRRLYTAFGWEHDTLLLVVSDHGEGLGQRGHMGHWFSLNHELTHALMLLHGLGIAPRVVEVNVSLVDVLPTLLDLLGFEHAPGRDGTSLASLLEEDAAEQASERLAERALFAHRSGARFRRNRGDELSAVILGRWKLIQRGRGQTLELFDLDADPGELRDLSAEHPELARALLERAEEFRRAAEPAEAVPVEVELDAELMEQLRSLGYAGDAELD